MIGDGQLGLEFRPVRAHVRFSGCRQMAPKYDAKEYQSLSVFFVLSV